MFILCRVVSFEVWCTEEFTDMAEEDTGDPT
jgi:hypothetical protein